MRKKQKQTWSWALGCFDEVLTLEVYHHTRILNIPNMLLRLIGLPVMPDPFSAGVQQALCIYRFHICRLNPWIKNIQARPGMMGWASVRTQAQVPSIHLNVGCSACSCHEYADETETGGRGDTRACWPSALAEPVNSSFSERHRLRIKKVERLRKTPDLDLWPPRIHVCTGMYPHEYVHTPHTHAI